MYDDPEVLKTSPYFSLLKQGFLSGAIARPSTVAGKQYGNVSEEYFKALHSVLTGERSSPNSAADLERSWSGITGSRQKLRLSTRVQPR